MAENMGEVIRRLRKERDMTQEELAEQLGITPQAISKWENNTAMPDISQVVPLANFFGVSTDTLFDFCSEDRKKDIEEYEKRALQLNNKGMIPELIALWREALAKYPGDYKCMSNLAGALFLANGTSLGDEAEKAAEEGVALCERVLDTCKDHELRERSIQLLTYWYSNKNLSIADEEKSVMYAKMGGDIWVSRQILLEKAYFTEEGEKEGRRVQDDNVLHFMDSICCRLSWRVEVDPENELRNCQTALTLWQALIPDGNFLFYHSRIYRLYAQIAECHAKAGRKAETFDALHNAAYHAKKRDSLPSGSQNFTSPFVSAAASAPEESRKNYSETEYELFRDRLSNPCFNFIRDDPEFAALTE